MEDGGWRMEDGGWGMEDGGWRMEDGGWRMEETHPDGSSTNALNVSHKNIGVLTIHRKCIIWIWDPVNPFG